ncbi:hypothetical protein F2P81_003327 [Scophthalmus maximus]|uniref:Uncharacterized protein n=1 Tax=Scophthalmus maximus TaxID=52904 RepID=A0A6A4TH64_SCOMX|nr:hypothetical protein F2P81_003327 [Scophthalmus maximus]
MKACFLRAARRPTGTLNPDFIFIPAQNESPVLTLTREIISHTFGLISCGDLIYIDTSGPVPYVPYVPYVTPPHNPPVVVRGSHRGGRGAPGKLLHRKHSTEVQLKTILNSTNILSEKTMDTARPLVTILATQRKRRDPIFSHFYENGIQGRNLGQRYPVEIEDDDKCVSFPAHQMCINSLFVISVSAQLRIRTSSFTGATAQGPRVAPGAGPGREVHVNNTDCLGGSVRQTLFLGCRCTDFTCSFSENQAGCLQQAVRETERFEDLTLLHGYRGNEQLKCRLHTEAKTDHTVKDLIK